MSVWTVRTLPVAPFRERFEASSLTAADVARRLGWFCRGRADGQRVQRVLGIRPWAVYGEQRTVTYDMAVALCDALEMDYTEANV